jgi:hypothetical protein
MTQFEQEEKAMEILWRAVLHLRQVEDANYLNPWADNQNARAILMDLRHQIATQVTP